ncbi:MAG: VWA domain-containing protein [Candidatus Roizmanbacteria bacterium]|nr:VWA domain-containing protein [Candidatus Roizmanbacteria bacterium]
MSDNQNLGNKKKFGKLSWFLIILIPYFILGLLLLINPFLHQSEYCPLPTALEQNLGIFPSVVNSWQFYAVAIPFVEVLLVTLFLTVSGIFLFLVSIFNSQIRHKALRRLFISLPFTTLIGGFLITSGMLFLLAQLDVGWRVTQSFSVGGILIILLAFLGSVIWLIVAGILERRSKDKQRKKQGTHTILAATLAIVVGFVLPLLVASTFFTGASVLRMPTSGGGGGYDVMMAPAGAISNFSSPIPMMETIGFATGGAKDADNFRENINNCYLPIPTDITYEGLYFDYKFDTRNETGCTSLFCPQYEAAIVPDPFNKQDEYFLSVGLGSNLRVEDFQRPPLDVVIVLDISGSMSSSFDKYYYDQFRTPEQRKQENNDWNTSKMETAKEAVSNMVDHLRADDRFGMVLFESASEQFIPFDQIGDDGYDQIKNKVATLEPRGGTNMEAGLTLGTQLIESLPAIEGEDRERRIIFLTDAMPNTGALAENELYRIGSNNAEKGIHTTFIGIGVDFNTELVELLTKEIRGANYFAVHSSSDFEKRLDTEFEYLVAPLLYDLTLSIEGGDYEIRSVYGSPEANKATGDVLRVSSLFPSPTSEGSSRGGVILAHLEQISNTGEPTKVIASYEDRDGEVHSEEQIVQWTNESKDNPSQNVRKAVLLARYVNLMQNWIIDENLRQGPHEKTIYIPIQPTIFYDDGLVIPVERYPEGSGQRYIPVELSQWERLSRRLVVSEDYKKVFDDFITYFTAEYQDLSEKDLLEQEVETLENLTKSPNP